MARKAKKPQKEPNHERWLITYSDLITLLMIFFIIMYSMSQINAAKYAAVANSLSLVLSGQAMSVLETQGPSLAQGISGQQMPEGGNKNPSKQGELEEVKKQIAEFIKAEDAKAGQKQAQAGQEDANAKLSDQITVTEQERGLVISFKEALLFPSGSDVLNPNAHNIIVTVGRSLVDLPNYIRVEGHTDNIPISSGKFPSNWELSVMRAANVVHVLNAEAGVPSDRLSIIGYGEYRPLVPNDSEANRAVNRRVDIVILKKKYDYFEPPSAPVESGQTTAQ
ncbi:MAG: flagellar motor protein MotB [Deltaproteobacteria bacterium]